MTKPSRIQQVALWAFTLAGAAVGAVFGFAGSMWGGIEVIMPVTVGLFGLVCYVLGRMAISALDAFRG